MINSPQYSSHHKIKAYLNGDIERDGDDGWVQCYQSKHSQYGHLQKENWILPQNIGHWACKERACESMSAISQYDPNH